MLEKAEKSSILIETGRNGMNCSFSPGFVPNTIVPHHLFRAIAHILPGKWGIESFLRLVIILRRALFSG